MDFNDSYSQPHERNVKENEILSTTIIVFS